MGSGDRYAINMGGDPSVNIGAQDIMDIVSTMPKNKACGRDVLVTGMWAAPIAADSRQAAHLAWATNQRVANGIASAGLGRHAESQDQQHATRPPPSPPPPYVPKTSAK